jgi:hypothetical protein
MNHKNLAPLHKAGGADLHGCAFNQNTCCKLAVAPFSVNKKV